MWALVAAVVCIIVATPILLIGSRRGAPRAARGAYPESIWSLPDVASRQVIIAGGLAGFAVTGMVLLVTLARDRADVRTDNFNAVVFMFLTAYLFFVATAFLFAMLPKEDADAHTPPRIQFALAANLQLRSVMIAWFALRPLMQIFGLDVLADLAAGAITASIALGGLFALAIFRGIGILNLAEVVLLPLLATASWVPVAVLSQTVLPELQSAKSELYLTGALYGLNVITFLHFSLGLMALTVPVVRRIVAPVSRRLCVAELQATMIMLSFLWMAVIGIV